ncbi:hypothetical protein [Metabacillus litoralis]|uniref:hypothetical protein n=1 Tax=Metabacillus litoralis TaxID=152268 RepID=UPI001CFF011D|nr:hypothetical protein [Metabacillus litoralis]
MVGQPTFFVLDDKMVAVFSVLQNNCEVKMECLFSKTGIEDYTLEYKGPLERKSELINLAKVKAQSIFKENVFSV